SFISALERGTSGASVSALQRLTRAYGATMLDLFGEAPARRVTRRTNRRSLDVVASGTRIEQLASGPALMEPQLFTLAPGASSDGAYEHDGEEFLFVLSGRVSVWLGDDERYVLAEGDALYFASKLPHRWRNEARGETRLLWINTPPTF
ncbi:MAG: cupin domain-containing protein, partial [Chloroflexota bacterium]|nr:cupin domain-containing protein [Chloroflexota bacterium]